MLLHLTRSSTGSHLRLKVDKLNNEQIATLVSEKYPGWELVEILTR